MKTVIQRVGRAAVTINGGETRRIGRGLTVLLGVAPDDTDQDILWLSRKIAGLRLFPDEEGKMNLSVRDIGGEILLISQFTLFGETKKGYRPSFSRSAPPETAAPLFARFAEELSRQMDERVVTGEFGAHMEVELVNDGPVTILIDSRDRG